MSKETKIGTIPHSTRRNFRVSGDVSLSCVLIAILSASCTAKLETKVQNSQRQNPIEAVSVLASASSGTIKQVSVSLTGRVWSPVAGSGEQAVANAKVEVISLLPDGTSDVLATGRTDALGDYAFKFIGVKSDAVFLASAFDPNTDKPIGQALMPIGAALELAPASEEIKLTGDINRNISVASTIAIQSNIELSTLSKAQLDQMVAITKTTLAQLGLESSALSPAELAGKVRESSNYLSAIAKTLGVETIGTRAAAVVDVWNQVDKLGSISSYFDEFAGMFELGSFPPKVVNPSGLPVLSVAHLNPDGFLGLHGKNAKGSIAEISIQSGTVPKRPSDAVTCLGKSGSLRVDCVTAHSVTPASDGTWTTFFDGSTLVDGALYEFVLSANTSSKKVIASRSYRFIWHGSAPNADFSVAGLTASGLLKTGAAAVSVVDPANINEFRIAENSNCASAEWKNFVVGAVPVVLSAGDGEKTLCVEVRDSFGGKSSATKTLTLDTEAPTVAVTIASTLGPLSLAGGMTDFSGTAGDSRSSLTSVQVSLKHGTSALCLDATKTTFNAACPQWIDTTGTISWALSVSDTVFTSGVSYELSVRAMDAAGNLTPTPATATFSWDSTPPSAPSASVATPTNVQRPTWTWSAGGGGSGNFRFKLDGSDLSTGATETVLTSFQPSTNLSEGTHTLYLQERDALGNWSSSGTAGVVIDITPPSPPSVSGASLSNNLRPTWNWTPGGGGSGQFRFKLDSSDLTAGATETIATAFSPGSNLSEGAHVLYVQERDATGNWSSSGSFTTTLDATPPGTFSITGPATPTANATPTVSWSSSSGATKYILKVAAASGCATPVQSYLNQTGNSKALTTLADGTWYVCLTAQDAALNTTAAINDNYSLVIASGATTVTNVSSSKADGSYLSGAVIDIRITFSTSVTVTGTPQIVLATTPSRVATYSSGSGSSVLVFYYSVLPGDIAADLDYAATNSLSLNGGTIIDGASNAALLTLPSPGAANSLANAKAIVIRGETKFTASDAAGADQNGTCVAVSGDTIMSTAIGDASNTGAAYIYRLDPSDNLWKETKITASDATVNYRFGTSCGLDSNTAVIGSYAVGGNVGAAYIFSFDPSDNLWKETKITASDGGGGVYFGYSAAVSGNTVVVGPYGMSMSAGAVYVYRLDPSDNLWKETKLTASDAAGGDYLGFSTAISGNTIVAGATHKSGDTGAAYVFRFDPSDSLWKQTKLTASDGVAGDRFGISCGISEGENIVVVGAAFKNSSAGAGYVYRLDPSDNLWKETKITASDSAASNYFGWRSAMSGEMIVFSSHGFSSNRGAAYIYRFDPSDNLWKESKISASAGASNDLFGASVSVDGNRIVVGEVAVNSFAGDVYSYEFPVVEGDGETKLLASDSHTGDRFGISSAISENTVVIGASNDDLVGSAYIYRFDPSDSLWKETKLTPSDGAATDSFGASVSVSGNTVAVGAFDANFHAGAAYIYRLDPSDNLWKETKLTASDAAAGDVFGTSVAISGKIIAVTALCDNANTGSVYIYRFDPSDNLWKETKVTASDGAPGDYFGRSVAVSEHTVVVGAYGGTGASIGAAYVYRLDPTDNLWKETKLAASDGAAANQFGSSSAVSGNTVVIGAYGGASGKGSAYVYRFDPSDNLWKETKLLASDGGVLDGFGSCGGVDGNTVVIGAMSHAGGVGAVYTYRLDPSDNAWKESKFAPSDGAAFDFFGTSCAVGGGTVLVGAYGDANYTGSAYLYRSR